MKIFFIGDTHFGKAYPFLKDYELNISKRNLDTIENCEKIIKTAIEEKADFVIFLGDLYDRQTISPTVRKIVRNRVFRPLRKQNIPVIVLGGNHDSIRHPNRGADIEELSNFPNVSVCTEFSTKIIDLKDGKKLGFVLLPYIHFDVLVDMARKSGISVPEGENTYIIAQHIIKTYISQICDKELNDCDKKVLIGHYYLEGARIREITHPSTLYGEFQFNKEMVQRELFDLIMFGHIHLTQKMWNDPRIVVLGSIDRLDFGEREDEKCYCVYNPEAEGNGLEFRKIECKNLFKIEIEIPEESEDYTEYILKNLPEKEKIINALCKVLIKVPKGKEVNVDKSKIDSHFREAYYFEVQYAEVSGEPLQHLRKMNLDPISLFNDFVEQKYTNYPYYEELKDKGIEILQKEFSAIDSSTPGPPSIKSIDVQNFNNYGKGPNKLEFDEDLYVIKGPTGSGKSSILDAITFALFKRSTRKDVGLKIEDILYKNGYVVLELLIGDTTITIKRGNKSPKLEVKVDGESLYKGLGISEVEKKIEDIIGYDYDSFISSFFIRQQELQIFSSLTSAERQKRLAKLFKLKIFQDADEQAKSILKDLEKNQLTIEGEIKGFEQLVAELPEHQKQKDRLINTLRACEKEKGELTVSIQKSEELIKKLTPDYEKYENICLLQDELKKTLKDNKNDLSKAKENQNKFIEFQKNLKNYDSIKEEKEGLEIRKEYLENRSQEKEGIENEIGRNIDLGKTGKKQFDKQRSEVMDQIAEAQNRLKIISAGISKDAAFNMLKENGKLSERLARLQEIEIPMAKEYEDKKRIKEFKLLEEATTNELTANVSNQDLITNEVFVGDELKNSVKSLKKKYNEVDKEGRDQEKQYDERITELKNSLINNKLTENFDAQLLEIKKELKNLKTKEGENF